MQNQEYEALINSCDKESAVRFLRTVFGKEFGGKEEKTAEGISIIGSVTLSDTNGRPKPVLCCFKAMEKNLTERSSRRKQFDDSVKVLKQVFAKPYMGNGPVNGVFTQGLFFFCDGNGNFRLSLVTSEIANGKQELNNYRRQSFFVESKERNNTFRHRLCKRISNFFELKESFNVEKLSDDFFKEYKVFYEDIVQYITGARFIEDKKNHYIREELSAPCSDIFDQFIESYDTTDNAEKAVRNYVKKLMGRLVFVQFLQKKGWLGIPVEKSGWNGGDPRFLQNLFVNASQEDKDNFIDKVLEDVLFYAFNTKETERKFKNKLLKQYKFPFLNGGLFEIDGDDKLNFTLPAEAFSNENREIANTERRNPYHKGWTKKRKPYFNKEACGLFDFFDRYNFTIDENDPSDAEVSVDPEMLGKIFENLLEDNKDKGAFYTPKEIVNYMVNESLIAYLDHSGKDAAIRDFVLTQKTSDFDEKKKFLLNEKLNDIKICDPAIGSGAFPMGILNTLVKCRLALSDLPDEKNALANFKRHIIQNNIYGVDIEKGAVDIARLRFWLSLVVDEEKPEALPNLDFKIMQGNSLLECYEGIDLSSVASGEKKRGPVKSSSQVSLVFDEAEAMKQIQKDLRSYYRTQEHSEKNSLKKAINEGVKNYLKFIAPEKRKEIDAMEIPNDKFFLWHTYFYDVFEQNGFDIVIGNPPYIKEYTNKAAFNGFREYSPYYIGKMDLWYGFACHGIDLLRPKGILCFIAQNNWTTSSGAKLLRTKVVNDSKLKQLVDFNTYMVFENADIQTMVMLFERNCTEDNYTLDYRTLLSGAQKEDMLCLLGRQTTNRTKFLAPKFQRKKYEGKLLTFSDNDAILDKIADKKEYLSSNEVIQGIIGNPDDAFKIMDKEIKTLLTEERFFIHKFHTHTERYCVDKSETNIIYLSSKTNSNININNLPNIKNRLLPYKKELSNRREVLKGSFSWFFLHWPRDEKVFKKGMEKIITQVRCEWPKFCYTSEEYYGSRALFFIQTSRWNMKFLTGILNSKLSAYWLKNKGKIQGELLKLEKEPLQNIPLPKNPTSAIQQPIVDLVDKILAAKQVNPQADTSDLESQIDALVYKLYDLSETEIEIIEKTSVKSKKDTENKNSVQKEMAPKKKYLVTTDEEL